MKGPASEIRKLLRTAFGLFIFAAGVSLTVQAGLGLAPWESLSMGVSDHLPLSFGITHNIITLIILAADLIMKEKIGYGTVLDALLVGSYLDFILSLGLIPSGHSLLHSLAMFIAGLFISAAGQYFYITAGIGCCPHDALMLAVGKRFRSIPVGVVQTCIYIAVLVLSLICGGPVGIGTVISVFFSGAAMQIIFRIAGSDPRDVVHHSITDSTKILFGHR